MRKNIITTVGSNCNYTSNVLPKKTTAKEFKYLTEQVEGVGEGGLSWEDELPDDKIPVVTVVAAELEMRRWRKGDDHGCRAPLKW